MSAINRAAKRRLGRLEQKKTITYQYNEYQVKQKALDNGYEFIDQIKKETTKQVVDIMMSVFTLSLHDVNGFGHVRIGRVLDKVKLQFACVESGHVRVSDIKAECKKFKVDIDNIIK